MPSHWLLSQAETIQKLENQSAPRAPISNFQVGACGVGVSGTVYCGVNLEFDGMPLSQAVHAEQFLLCLMVHSGESGVRALAVTAVPCGHCRQFMKEYKRADEIMIHVVGSAVESKPLLGFLPDNFGPADLCIAECMFASKARGLALIYAGDELERETLACLNRFSHAPYSGCLSAVGLLCRGGEVVTGVYLESAAFNPSLPPAQSALINLVARGRRYEDVVRVVLLEVARARITHQQQTRMLFRRAPVHVRHCVLPSKM